MARRSRIDLPIDLYRRTLIAAGQNGLNESMLAPLRPWFAAITLTQAALERTGYRGEFGWISTSPSGQTTAANPSSDWRPCWNSSAISRAS